MAALPTNLATYARYALAGIRLVVGTGSLVTPRIMARRFGIDADANPHAIYLLRLFGVRTVVIGAELLLPESEARARNLRIGVAIHLSDAVAALLAGARRQLPRHAAMTAAGVSTLNALLAVAAQTQPRHPSGKPS